MSSCKKHFWHTPENSWTRCRVCGQPAISQQRSEPAHGGASLREKAEKYALDKHGPCDDAPIACARAESAKDYREGYARAIEDAARIGDGWKPAALDGRSVGDEIRKLAED